MEFLNVPFGSAMRHHSFCHHGSACAEDAEERRLNNGSFGCCPAAVLEKANEWRHKWLHNPDDVWLNDLESGMHAGTMQIIIDTEYTHLFLLAA